jgi:regulator of sirC expression with transglutaminase-like and TPR domain
MAAVTDEARMRSRASLSALAGRPSEMIPLDEAALLIAAENYPDLDVAAYLAKIDALANAVRSSVAGAEDVRAAGSILAAFLHDEVGFRGNPDDYYDPRNSFLNEVLDRKVGIPITLSILYMEIGKRLGLNTQGIGLPGHFLVRLADVGMYVDPFTGESDLTEADCEQRVKASSGGRFEFDRAMLTPATNREILTRVLRNLAEIYRARGERPELIAALDRLLLLNPGSARLHRERARVLTQAGEYRRALRDISQVRRLRPGARRGERFRAWHRFVREMAARMN